MENEKVKKGRFGKGVLVGILVTILSILVLSGAAIGMFLVRNQEVVGFLTSSESTESAGQLNLQRVVNKVELLEQVMDHYFLFDSSAEDMETGIYKGMLAGLGDPYTTYYTPEEYRAMTEETEGIYCGIGVQVSQNRETGIITIIRVFPGSPAEEAGLKKGDILYKVGDLETYEQELDTLVSQHIRGEEGTFVDLTVLRDGEEVSAAVERRMVEVVTVESQLLPDKTGYVMVTQFDLVTADQFIEAVENLKKAGMERLVLDLRDNPGGVVDACVKMAAYLLPEEPFDGTILSTADKNGEGDRYYCADGKLQLDGAVQSSLYPIEDGHEFDMPMAVLINGMSASASEVLAGALRDYDKAVLVGTTSFGKGIVQSLLPLDDGSAIKVTTAHYYTPAGHDIHKQGLEPDVEIKLELPEEFIGQYDVPLDQDNQVQKAIEVLKENNQQ